jgi:hypothetical protein
MMATLVSTPDLTENQPAPRRFEPRDLMDENGRLLKLLYTTKEAAYILGVDEKSIYRLINRDLLKTNPAFRIMLIHRASLEAFAKMTL